jgi:phosphatidylserine/phosphatidylglycerophosphate/cardiolipin synthase-like enzyme
MKGERYARTASRLGWLVHDVEHALLASSEGRTVDSVLVRACTRRRLPTADETEAVLDALLDLGVLRNEQGVLRLSKKNLADTEGFRSGVWQGLRVSSADDEKGLSIRLCLTLPPELETAIKEGLRREAADLRAAILEIIVSARRELVLASPFWDEETADEIGELLRKRIEAGVQVIVLGRFVEPSTSALTASLRQLSESGRCRVLSWFNVSQGVRNVQTFHFKAAVADKGNSAYVGTANFTTSGLRSRMELGVIVSGEPARQVYRIISVALGLARPAF